MKTEVISPEMIVKWYKEHHAKANQIINDLLEDFQDNEQVTAELKQLKRHIKAMNFFSK